MASGVGGSFLGGLTGSTIGSAVVRLSLDQKGYQAGLASAEAQTKSAQTTTQKFGQYAAAAWAVAGTAVVAFGAASVKAYQESAAVQAELTSQIGDNTSALKEQADALQYLTGVEDEQILQADVVLSRFKLTQSEIQTTIPLVLDYARAQGTDAVSAAQAFGKAMLGNTRAIKGVGGEFEITGNRTKDLAALQGILADKVGGASTELSEEEKNANRARIAMSELQEGFGQFIMQAVEPLVSDLADLAQAFEGLTSGSGGGGVSLLGDSIKLLTSDFNPLIATLHYTTSSLQYLDSALGGIEPTVVPAEGAVQDLQERMARLGLTSTKTGKQFALFAHMSGKELKDWRTSVGESFDDVIFDLSNLTDHFEVTRKSFIRASKAMEGRAQELAKAMRSISKEKWVNEDYIKFLSDQGPEWLVGFSKLTESEQHKAQKAWEESTRKTDQAKGSLDRVTGALRDLNNTNAKATATVEFKSAGDPALLALLNGAGPS